MGLEGILVLVLVCLEHTRISSDFMQEFQAPYGTFSARPALSISQFSPLQAGGHTCRF